MTNKKLIAIIEMQIYCEQGFAGQLNVHNLGKMKTILKRIKSYANEQMPFMHSIQNVRMEVTTEQRLKDTEVECNFKNVYFGFEQE